MIFTDSTQAQTAGRMPAILAIGDSWFHYPANNLLLEFSRIVKPEFSDIFAIGYVGAKLSEYVNGGKYAAAFARQLEPDAAKYYSAVLISGAGNDAVDWSFALCSDCSAFSDPAACIDALRIEKLLAQIWSNYMDIIDQIDYAYAHHAVTPDIILHTYDRPPVNGVGFDGAVTGPLGPWITNAMDRCGVVNDRPFREATAALFIDRLQQRLATLHNPDVGVHVVQSVGALDPRTDWANELHPTPSGFRKIAESKWRPVLETAGLA